MGDRYWYGDGVPSSKEKAASNYAEAFNLAESPRVSFAISHLLFVLLSTSLEINRSESCIAENYHLIGNSKPINKSV